MRDIENRPFAFLTAIFSTVLATTSLAQTPTQPNIIFVMVDDAGIGDFSSYTPSTPVQTPNLDALAANGLRFTNAYAGSTVCAPSRSALLTGQHMGHTRVRGNFNSMLHDADVTLGEVMQQAGYATGGFGKWGIGMPGTTGSPERHGFETFVGYQNQVHAHSHYTPHLYQNGQRLDIPENVGFNEPETGLVSDARVMAHNLIVDRMHDFIAENAQSNTPFFAYGAWTPPHRKSTMPQSEANPGGAYAPYANMPWDERAKIQAAFVTMVDRQVGNVVQQVNDLGIADNTLILFASDNGGWEPSELQAAYDRNAGLRGSKGSMYEGGLRTPLIASWQGQIAAGATSDLITYFPDLMPTFADLAGAPEAVPTNTDGVSIVPTLLDQGTQELHEAIYFETGNLNGPNPSSQAVRMGDWKMTRGSSGSIQLYNLANDPLETTNVQSSNPSVVTQIAALMDANHDPMYPQFRVSGNGGVAGVVGNGIRPGVIANRNWSIDAAGDAQSITETIVDELGDNVRLYVDDLHQQYQLELTVNRVTAASPEILVELVGDSNTAFYSASYDTSQQVSGSTVDVVLDFVVMNSTPEENTLTGDLNDPLTLRISHAGGSGQVLVSEVAFVGGPMFADLDFDDDIDAADWIIQRDNLFSDLTALAALDAYELGDLNTDGFNNELDFLLFKRAYENAHGSGSFSDMLAGVPEPTSGLLLITTAIGIFTRARKQRQATT